MAPPYHPASSSRSFGTLARPSLLAAAFAVLSGAVLSGCASGPPPYPPAATMILSPNGEPLTGGPLGQAPCDAVLGAWMERTDTNHDGLLGADELLADARAQFDRMDQDVDGFVTAAELQAHRLPYRPPRPSRAEQARRDAEAGAPPPGRRQRGGGSGQRPSGSEPRNSIGGQAEPPDPVMAADMNLDFRVSRDELLAHTKRVFARLDTDRDGRLDRAEATASCRPPR